MSKLIIELPNWQINKTDLAEIADKMQAIDVNLPYIDIKEVKEAIQNDDFTINAYPSDQYDEFYLMSDDKHVCHIEVVTREVAIANDKEYLSYLSRINGGDMSEYEVGGKLSDYKKLGNSIYYYKEM